MARICCRIKCWPFAWHRCSALSVSYQQMIMAVKLRLGVDNRLPPSPLQACSPYNRHHL